MSTETIIVLKESQLKDGQMKEVPFGDGRVLLSRLGDKIHATSAYCTHYGAPLSTGVLTADGRVVCPWHGACFNVCSGDIEDAPGPAPLHTFQVAIKSGQIYVTADRTKTKPENKSRPPKVLSYLEESGPGTVIVGGGSGAFGVAESLREFGYKKSITILSKEPHAPIDRTKLSKALMSDASKLELRSPAELKIKLGVTLRTNTTVTSVNTDKRFVVLQSQEQVPYESLVLSTGGTPRKLPLDGVNAPNVFVLRSAADAKALDEACQEGKRLVIIGTSFIGMEVAVAVSKRKLASINLVGMTEVPLQPILGKQIGASIQKYQESQGIVFHGSASARAIRHKSDGTSEVELTTGKVLPADAIVLAVGVRVETDFLKDSGFTLEQRDGSVGVDEYLRVPGKPNVYAIGDIATYKQAQGGSRRIEHWNVAQNHGRTVGRTIVGISQGKPEWVQAFDKVPIFWSALGQQLRYCGIDTSFDDIIIDGDTDELKFAAYYVKAGKVIAVATMQRDPIVSRASELFRLGLMPSAEEISSGLKGVLDVDISSSGAKSRFLTVQKA